MQLLVEEKVSLSFDSVSNRQIISKDVVMGFFGQSDLYVGTSGILFLFSLCTVKGLPVLFNNIINCRSTCTLHCVGFIASITQRVF